MFLHSSVIIVNFFPSKKSKRCVISRSGFKSYKSWLPVLAVLAWPDDNLSLEFLNLQNEVPNSCLYLHHSVVLKMLYMNIVNKLKDIKVFIVTAHELEVAKEKIVPLLTDSENFSQSLSSKRVLLICSELFLHSQQSWAKCIMNPISQTRKLRHREIN